MTTTAFIPPPARNRAPYTTPDYLDPTVCISQQILDWFYLNDEPDGLTSPEMAAAFGDVSNSLQPRVKVLRGIGCLEYVGRKVNPLTGMTCRAFRRTAKPYDPEEAAAWCRSRSGNPFTWAGFREHFLGLSDTEAEELIDRINALAAERWS